jgi:hypothetical protein
MLLSNWKKSFFLISAKNVPIFLNFYPNIIIVLVIKTKKSTQTKAVNLEEITRDSNRIMDPKYP